MNKRKTRLKYLVYDPDPRGNERYYVRKPGRRKIRIRSLFTDSAGNITREFMDEYWAALEGAAPDKRSPNREGTFYWFVDQYLKSDEFKDLDPETQKVRRSILNRFCEGAGEFPFKQFRHEDAIRSRDKRRSTPGAADNLIKALRRLFNWGIEQNLAFHNPTNGIKKILKSDGHHTWTPEEVDQFRSHHALGTRARLALELMIHVGARRSDAASIGRQNEHDGWLRFTARKNRRRAPVTIEVPIAHELQRAILETKTGELTYLITSRGHPFTIESFGNKFREWCDEAKLYHCTAHGLRKASAVMLAENGASAPELCAIFGWSKLETAEIYIRKAQKRKMAGNAFARLEDYKKNKSVSLSKNSSDHETKRRNNLEKSTPK